MLFIALTIGFMSCKKTPETPAHVEPVKVKLFDAVFYVDMDVYTLQFTTKGVEGNNSVNVTSFSFTINSVKGKGLDFPKGTYTLKDMDNKPNMTFVETPAGQELYKEVTLNFENKNVTAEMVDVKGNKYKIVCTDDIVFDEYYGGGGGETDLFKDEPKDKTTINFTATELFAEKINYTTAGYSYSEGNFTLKDSQRAIDLYLTLAFNADHKGTFQINKSFANNTILASSGCGDPGLPQPSCMYNVGAEETKVAPYYFFASGTVTITANSITVNATSHFGSTINATYNGAVNPTIITK